MSCRAAVTAKPLGALALPQAAALPGNLAAARLPVNLAATAAALLVGRPARSRPSDAGRCAHAPDGDGQWRQDDQGVDPHPGLPLAGHRVVLIESAKYQLTGHRFSDNCPGLPTFATAEHRTEVESPPS